MNGRGINGSRGFVCAGRRAGITLAVLLSASEASQATTYHAVDLFALQTPSDFSSTRHFDEQPAASGQAVGYGYGTATGGAYHALLWAGSAGNVADLNPTGFDQSWGRSVSGSQQVGFGKGTSTAGAPHALLWSGSAGSAIDLHPGALFTDSYAYGLGGGQQVGSGCGIATGNQQHALLWSGSAASAMDLHPNLMGPLGQSFAYGVGGGQQVGAASGPTTGYQFHGLLWSGSANSAIDLNPSGFYESYSYDTDGSQQVGKGNNTQVLGVYHALLWSGSAASATDLNPSGFAFSAAYGVGGGHQVGSGYGAATGDKYHALLWSGTAGSSVDLHRLLPASFTASYAYTIDASGAIFGLGADSNGLHAIKWLPFFADFNGDSQVDVSDLGILATNWQRSADFAHGDASGDGMVDITDLGLLASEWQLGAAAFSTAMDQAGLGQVTVPEPSQAALLLLPLSAVALRRRQAKVLAVGV